MTQPTPSRQPGDDVRQGDAPRGAAPPAGQQQPLDSAALLQGGRSVAIRHNGELYRLQATRLGKLILTK